MKYLNTKTIRKTGSQSYKTLQHRLIIKRVEAKPLQNPEKVRRENIVDYAQLGTSHFFLYWLSLIGRKTWREIDAADIQMYRRAI